MATTNKTTVTKVNVNDFINEFVDKEQKKADSHQLIELMSQWSGCKAYMWGPTIIGFGSYHYQYATGHQGDAPILGFSPRKAALSLYVYVPTEENKQLLATLGKFKMGKVCIYVNKLEDIDLSILEKISKNSMDHTISKYHCTGNDGKILRL